MNAEERILNVLIFVCTFPIFALMSILVGAILIHIPLHVLLGVDFIGTVKPILRELLGLGV